MTKILFLSLNPLTNFILETGTLKCKDRILITALLANPLTGFSFTLISKLSSDFLIISSFFEFGKTLTLINIILYSTKKPPSWR